MNWILCRAEILCICILLKKQSQVRKNLGLLSLSNNFQISSVFYIIKDTGVVLWISGEKEHRKNQLSLILIRWFQRNIFCGKLKGLWIKSGCITGHAEMEMTEHYLHIQTPIRKDAVIRFSNAF